jgi:hypothetical protein
MTLDALLPAALVAQIPPILPKRVQSPSSEPMIAWARFLVPTTGELFYLLRSDGRDRCYVLFVSFNTGVMGGQEVSLSDMVGALGGDPSKIVRDEDFSPCEVTPGFLNQHRAQFAA